MAIEMHVTLARGCSALGNGQDRNPERQINEPHATIINPTYLERGFIQRLWIVSQIGIQSMLVATVRISHFAHHVLEFADRENRRQEGSVAIGHPIDREACLVDQLAK